MKKITVVVYSLTGRGNNLLTVLNEFAKTGNDVKFIEPATVLDAYNSMNDPDRKITVEITGNTERGKAVIELIRDLKPATEFYIRTENTLSDPANIPEEILSNY